MGQYRFQPSGSGLRFIMATALPPLDLCTVLTESKRIINAHSRHFLSLSVLFLLPISFSLTVFSTLRDLLTHSSTPNFKTLVSVSISVDVSFDHTYPFFPSRTIILSLIFSLFIIVFAVLSLGSITYSVIHGFYGRPVKLLSAILSAFTSFIPLLITTMLTQSINLLMLLSFGLPLLFAIKGLQLEFSSPFFVGFSAIILIVLLLVLVYLQVNWALATVVVVAESKFGIQPLKRSSILIKGMRSVALGLLLLFGFLTGFLLVISSVSGATLGVGISNGWKSCAFVLQIVVSSTFLMILLLYIVAANTVMYMYCKVVHGELAWEIAEEFTREYVSLPYDDGKVPHLVSVAHT